MLGIKSNWAWVVKILLTLPFLCQNAFSSEDLPDIEAQAFKVSVVRKTTSGRVYLFNDFDLHKPPPGKIFLIKENSAPVMGFRVLKSYDDAKQFAAKQIKRYTTPILERDHEYVAWQKLRDLHDGTISPAPVPAEDEAEVKELEAAANANAEARKSPEDEALNDAELAKKLDAEPAEKMTVEEAVTLEQLEIREYPELDRYSNGITLQMGLLRNVTAAGDSTYFTGGGVRYGYNFAKHIFTSHSTSEDSLTLEGSVFYYRVLQFQSPTDEYAILPWGLNLRYNFMYSEIFGVFLYGGFFYNLILSSTNQSGTATTLLGGFRPAFGGGLLYTMGPHWQMRLDVGYDLIGIGLVLRY